MAGPSDQDFAAWEDETRDIPQAEPKRRIEINAVHPEFMTDEGLRQGISWLAETISILYDEMRRRHPSLPPKEEA